MSRIITPPARYLRMSRLAWGLSLFAVATVGTISGCSSSDQKEKASCDGAHKGQCGMTCSTDADCADGVYCSPSSGTCFSDCVNDSQCASGQRCSAKGRCAFGTLFGSDAGLGSQGDANCVTDVRSGEGLAADIYIMNDQSQSMSCAIPTGGDRWTAMTTALTNFVNSPEAAGLGVGIQYFGLGSGNQGRGSCNAQDYASADVEIAPLPGNAQPIIDSLGRHGPSTYTPTPAAIDGAILHATAWQIAHPARATTIVLATDGQPNLCGDPADRIGSVAASAARALAGTPSIRTYVIGIVGGSGDCNLDPAPPNKPDLDRVASAGGTQESIIVDAANGDTSAQFLAALNKIRDAAVIPCQYVMPKSTAGKVIDPNTVNIVFTPSGGTQQELLQADNEAACPGTGGWYYDDMQNPTKILLCKTTCDQVTADTRNQINVYIGCRPTQKVTR